jgi:hypothetical protein
MPRIIELQNDELTISILLQSLTLPPNSTKVLLYLYSQCCLHSSYPLSSKELCKHCNISRVTYMSAFKNLIECGYLQETSTNHYILNMKGADIDG